MSKAFQRSLRHLASSVLGTGLELAAQALYEANAALVKASGHPMTHAPWETLPRSQQLFWLNMSQHLERDNQHGSPNGIQSKN